MLLVLVRGWFNMPRHFSFSQKLTLRVWSAIGLERLA